MRSHRTITKPSSTSQPTLGLIVSLGDTAVGPTQQQLVRRLVSDKIAATWAVSQPEQLRSFPTSTAAVQNVAACLQARTSAEQTISGLRNAGFDVTTALGSASQLRSESARLGSLGVTSTVVAKRGTGAKPCRLPGEGWQFEAGVCLPQVSSWPRLFRPSPARRLLDASAGRLAVVVLDAAALEQASARERRQIDRLLTAMAWAQQGELRIVPIAEVAALQSQRCSVTPQRSILRVA